MDALGRNADRVLDADYEAGIRYFDAARAYRRAEAFLGSWLERRRVAPGEVTVASKWGYTYTADWRVQADPPEVKDLSATTLWRQLGETLELLGDHLALHQIHPATIESGVLDDREVLDELGGLRASGVAIGFTTTGPGKRRPSSELSKWEPSALRITYWAEIDAQWSRHRRSGR